MAHRKHKDKRRKTINMLNDDMDVQKDLGLGKSTTFFNLKHKR